MSNINVDKFMEDLKLRAERNNIILEFSSSKSLKVGEKIYCSGYFEENKLAVATGKKQSIWLPILVHESCHMDQYIEKVKPWLDTDVAQGVDVLSIIDLWIMNKIELSNEQLNDYIKKAFAVERDCERRTLLKIKKYDLPIRYNSYIRKANAYIMLYLIVQYTRKWTKRGKGPYSCKDIWSQMPTELLYYDDCKKMYEGFYPLYSSILS